MKLLSRTAVTVALVLGTSCTAFASTYTYQNEQIGIAFKGDNVIATYCTLKEDVVDAASCREKERSVDELKKVLVARIKEGEKLLSNTDAVKAEAKKIVSDNTSKRITDKETGKSYVMLPIMDGMVLPFDEELAEKGDYSLVVGALEANVGRFKRALDHLESGKLPASIKTEKYGEVSQMLELQNVIEFGG
jgi:hypothetical protein